MENYPTQLTFDDYVKNVKPEDFKVNEELVLVSTITDNQLIILHQRIQAELLKRRIK